MINGKIASLDGAKLVLSASCSFATRGRVAPCRQVRYGSWSFWYFLVICLLEMEIKELEKNGS